MKHSKMNSHHQIQGTKLIHLLIEIEEESDEYTVFGSCTPEQSDIVHLSESEENAEPSFRLQDNSNDEFINGELK